MRTADLKLRTDDVIQTTFTIEKLVDQWNRYVANTQLKTTVDQHYTTPISEDSLHETTKYTMMDRMIIRIPSANLDITLKSFVTLVDLLDHRTVTATDVKLQLLSNRMTQERIAKHEARITKAIDDQGKKQERTAEEGTNYWIDCSSPMLLA